MRVALCMLLLVSASAYGQPREIYIPITQAWPLTDDGDQDGANITLPIANRGASVRATIIDFWHGRIIRRRLRWDGEEPGWYEITVRADADDRGYYHLAVALHSGKALRTVRIARRDAARVQDLRGSDFVWVEEVGRYGLDVDGDARADVAFARVCTHEREICVGLEWRVARRAGTSWQLARRCRQPGTPNEDTCRTF